MAETGTMEIDGKKMKLCPGWEGNGFRCGRGNPRLIAASAEVCENCSRGMRKRGQKTREEEAEEQRRIEAAKAKILLGVAAFEAALGVPVPKAAILNVLEALEELTEGSLGETYSYYKDDEIGSEKKLEILYAAVGKEQPERKRSRGYYR